MTFSGNHFRSQVHPAADHSQLLHRLFGRGRPDSLTRRAARQRHLHRRRPMDLWQRDLQDVAHVRRALLHLVDPTSLCYCPRQVAILGF